MELRRATRRELVVLAVTLVGLSRLLEGGLIWIVALLILGVMLLGSLQVLGEREPLGVPIESLLTPTVAALAALGAVRFVPIGLGMLAALLAAGILIERALVVEGRALRRPKGPTAEDRILLLIVILVAAFLGFAGVAVAIPNALVEPAGPAGTGPGPLPADALVLLAGADAILAALLGYRLAALNVPSVRQALWAALTYAAAVGIGAAALRAMAFPRLLGPALLTLLVYLWSAYLGAPRAGRGQARWIWEVVLLASVGVVVVAWNLLLRA